MEEVLRYSAGGEGNPVLKHVRKDVVVCNEEQSLRDMASNVNDQVVATIPIYSDFLEKRQEDVSVIHLDHARLVPLEGFSDVVAFEMDDADPIVSMKGSGMTTETSALDSKKVQTPLAQAHPVFCHPFFYQGDLEDEAGASNEPPRAQLISAMLENPLSSVRGRHGRHGDEENAKIGIRLENNRIMQIAGASFLRNTPLREGDLLLSINGRNCQRMSASMIAKAIQDTPSDASLHLIAYNESGQVDLVESMVTKSSPDQLIGFRLRGGDHRHCPAVAKIDHDGLIANHSLLNVDDKLLLLNGVCCASSHAEQVRNMIQESSKQVNILARVHPNNGIVTSELSCHSPDDTPARGGTRADHGKVQDPQEYNGRAEYISILLLPSHVDELGIRLQGNMITKIFHSSILFDSPLQPGDRIIGINGEACHDLSTNDVRKKLRSCRNAYLHLVAYNENTVHPDLVHLMIPHRLPADKLGTRIKGILNGYPQVGHVEPDGLLSRTLFQTGDKFIRFNDKVSCHGLSAEQLAKRIVQNSKGKNRTSILAVCPDAYKRVPTTSWSDCDGEEEPGTSEMRFHQDPQAQDGIPTEEDTQGGPKAREPEMSGSHFITIVIPKPQTNAPLGLRLRQNRIVAISDSSMISDLREGDEIVSMNGRHFEGMNMNAAEVTDAIKSIQEGFLFMVVRRETANPALIPSTGSQRSPSDDGRSPLKSIVLKNESPQLQTTTRNEAMELDATESQEIPTAKIVSIMIPKPPTHTPWGLRLKKNQVIGISESSFLSDLPLQEGDRIVSVNGIHCEGMNAIEIANILKNQNDDLFLVARRQTGDPSLIECTITKRASNDVIGLRLQGGGNDECDGPPKISGIRPDGLISKSLLTEGDDVIAVNGISCDKLSAETAASILRQLPSQVTLLVRNDNAVRAN